MNPIGKELTDLKMVGSIQANGSKAKSMGWVKPSGQMEIDTLDISKTEKWKGKEPTNGSLEIYLKEAG